MIEFKMGLFTAHKWWYAHDIEITNVFTPFTHLTDYGVPVFKCTYLISYDYGHRMKNQSKLAYQIYYAGKENKMNSQIHLHLKSIYTL